MELILLIVIAALAVISIVLSLVKGTIADSLAPANAREP